MKIEQLEGFTEVEICFALVFLKRALKDCIEAMKRAQDEGVVDHLDCCDDGGQFWYDALQNAESMMRRPENTL